MNKAEQKTAEFNDLQLIKNAQSGSRDAFNTLMLKYHHRGFNLIFRIFGNYTQADEVAQDVFVRAYQGIKGFKFKSSFMTWLYSIAVNLARNRIKKNLKEKNMYSSLNVLRRDESDSYQEREIADSRMSADRALLNKEMQGLIQCAINSLADDFRIVVVLRDVQMLSYEEISQMLGVNINTVKSRIYRARIMLQEKLREVM